MDWTVEMRHLFTNNWFIKLASLLIAFLLWLAVASETSSEVVLQVPLEYRNIPPELEVAGETTNTVQVRLRGSANAIKEVSAQSVATTIDLGGARIGERILPLTAQNVSAPFGVDVVMVSPSQVRVNLERTLSRRLPVTPVIDGAPAPGYEVFEVRVYPEEVEVYGPESRVAVMKSVPTIPVRIAGEQNDLRELVELDTGESMVRAKDSSPVEVQVHIRPGK
jgi:YbbR domain-containing protein